MMVTYVTHDAIKRACYQSQLIMQLTLNTQPSNLHGVVHYYYNNRVSCNMD